ncbi:hypothetical protein FQA39_LY19291 [Lamprigera yunnana]|nr:hypothetical protein FQA39_LY19291 [Lamprigera yunnana]
MLFVFKTFYAEASIFGNKHWQRWKHGSAQCNASGMGATLLSYSNVPSGDEIISSRTNYAERMLSEKIFTKAAIQTKFVDITNLKQAKNAINENKNSAYCETIRQSALKSADIETLSKIRKKNTIKIIVDNTFSPIYVTPLIWAQDVVIHSLTKFHHGSSDAVGVVEQGEIIGLLGPNGTGKNDFFYILSYGGKPQRQISLDKSTSPTIDVPPATKKESVIWRQEAIQFSVNFLWRQQIKSRFYNSPTLPKVETTKKTDALIEVIQCEHVRKKPSELLSVEKDGPYRNRALSRYRTEIHLVTNHLRALTQFVERHPEKSFVHENKNIESSFTDQQTNSQTLAITDKLHQLEGKILKEEPEELANDKM